MKPIYIGPMKFRVHVLCPMKSHWYAGPGREKKFVNHRFDANQPIAMPAGRLVKRGASGESPGYFYSALDGISVIGTFGQESAEQPEFHGPATERCFAEEIAGMTTRIVPAASIASLPALQSEMEASLRRWLGAASAPPALPKENGDFREESIDVSGPYKLPKGTVWKTMRVKPIFDAFLAAMRNEGKSWEQWEVDDISWSPKQKDGQVSGEATVKVKKRYDDDEHIVEYKGEVILHLYSVNDELVLKSEPDPADNESPFGKAREAKEKFEGDMKKAINDRANGKTPTIPEGRPPETMDPKLTPEQREQFDDWWENMEELKKTLKTPAKKKTDDELYADYLAAGGKLSKDDFLGLMRGGLASSPSKPGDKNWLQTAADLLGLGIEKTGDVIMQLGKDGTNLLKDWGPVGTVGVYTGVKAADSVIGSNKIPNWVIYGGLALLAFKALK